LHVTDPVDQLRGFIDTIPTLAWAASADDSAEAFNQRWLHDTGLILDEAPGFGWKAAIPQTIFRICRGCLAAE
jgi:hypothetical protein